MTVDEAVRIVLSGQDQTHEMLATATFLLRMAIGFLIAASVMGVLVVAAQIYEIVLHVRTVRKINFFLDWAQKYMDNQGPIQDQVLSLIAVVQEKTTGTLNKIENTVKKGAEDATAAAHQAAVKAAEVVAAMSINGVPPSDSGNKIPVVQGM